MTTTLLALIEDCGDAQSQAQFWAGILGHHVHVRNPGEYEVSDPSDPSTPMYFMNVPEGKVGKNRLHVDVATDLPLEEEVSRIVAAGGSLVEMRQDPATFDHPDTWAVMQDPEGNEFCVLNAETVTGMA
jgi:predicted enzyme related to lactoylglutathione lyase